MFRKKILLLTAVLSLVFSATAQQISVKSFLALPNDMDARQNYPEKDQNGELCAIIKVVTLEKGFFFDIGSLGITKTVQKAGEIWLWIPHGAKRINISHIEFLPLRDFAFTETIKEGMCYELAINCERTEQNQVLGEKEEVTLLINTIPAGAEVYIDEVLLGKTPILTPKIPIGEHIFKISKEKFATVSKTIVLSKNESNVINETLDSIFSLTINSDPVGAIVNIDSIKKGLTPVTFQLGYGNSLLQVTKPGYISFQKDMMIQQKHEELNVKLEIDQNQVLEATKKYKTYKKYSLSLLGAGLVFAAGGTATYFLYEKHLSEYPTASTDATKLHKLIQIEQVLYPVFLGLGAVGISTSVVFFVKQGNAKQIMNLGLQPAPGGGEIKLSYNF
jgi:hypothetical protein